MNALMDLRIGSRVPVLLIIFTGVRGVGRTIMLGAAEDWRYAAGGRSSPKQPVLDSFGEAGNACAGSLTTWETVLRGAGSRPFPWQVSPSPPSSHPKNRSAGVPRGVTLLWLRKVRDLIITVDEIHASDRAELARLAGRPAFHLEGTAHRTCVRGPARRRLGPA